jgi:hypothetical protein
MKAIILLTMSLLVNSSLAFAEEEFCDILAQKGQGTMELRQSGMPMSQLRKLIDDATKEKDESIKMMYEFLMVRAYKYKIVEGEKAKAAAVAKFSNEIRSYCRAKMAIK